MSLIGIDSITERRTKGLHCAFSEDTTPSWKKYRGGNVNWFGDPRGTGCGEYVHQIRQGYTYELGRRSRQACMLPLGMIMI